MYSASWLADVLRRAGLKVAETDGWKTRGRAEMGTVKGVICHHTAGPKGSNMPSLGVVTNGRSDLPGPLAQLCLGRDGTWYVVAAGRANHAGKGLWRGVDAGNSNMIGVEAENSGLADDQPWPEVQMEAYARGVAAILSHVGAGSEMCCGHKEYALPHGRKIDPCFDMDAFRARVAGFMNGAPPRPPIPKVDAAGRPTLRRGDRDSPGKTDVVELQRGIRTAIFDGRFGPTTEAVLREFQRKHGLTSDGVAGPSTWAVVDKK